MIFKNIFLDFSTEYFYFLIFRVLAGYSRSTVPKFSIEILKRDFDETLKRFFQKPFKIIYRDASNSKIFVWATSYVKMYQFSLNLDKFLQ